MVSALHERGQEAGDGTLQMWNWVLLGPASPLNMKSILNLWIFVLVESQSQISIDLPKNILWHANSPWHIQYFIFDDYHCPCSGETHIFKPLRNWIKASSSPRPPLYTWKRTFHKTKKNPNVPSVKSNWSSAAVAHGIAWFLQQNGKDRISADTL